MSTATTEIVAIRDEEWSVARIVDQTKKVQECMKAVMIRDEHYGVIPGTNTKPTLLKPGAEKLCLLFRLCPEYETMRAEQTRELVSYTVRCVLTHIPTGNRVASGLGSCNSREKKYLRPADKRCPNCNKETIIKGKEEFGGGWLCWAKKGGCNAKFKDGDATIEQQDTGLADPSDLDNTILKMACKRALVAAVLNGTAASDCFTQDLEDLTEKAAEYTPPPPREPVDPAYRATVGDTNSQSPGGRAPASGPMSAPRVDSAPAGGEKPALPKNGRTKGDSSEMEEDFDKMVTPSNGKKPVGSGANAIAHDGKMCTHAQVVLIHMLRSKVSGTYAGPDEDARSAWRKVIGVYRDQKDERITTSPQLSMRQASHLIDRMEAEVKKQAAVGAKVMNDLVPEVAKATDMTLIDAFNAAFETKEEATAWCNGRLGMPGPDEVAQEDEEYQREVVAMLVPLGMGDMAGYQRELDAFRARRL